MPTIFLLCCTRFAKVKYWLIRAVWLLFSLLLTACSNHLAVQTSYSQYFNFLQNKQYAMYERGSTLYQQQNIADNLRNVIELSLENTFDQLGLHNVHLAQANIIFSYHVIDGDVSALARYNRFVHFCVRCSSALTQHKQSATNAEQADHQSDGADSRRGRAARRSGMRNYLPQGLIIDAIDPKTRASVWRMQQPLAIKVKDNSLIIQQKIKQSISTAFQKYPLNMQIKK